ncbi:MAG: 2,3-bisphosphoglycerate-independent phosphoglycerate mutase, partial [Burkholderiales bacterium]|nr:2,3-bisphosphoglycerate-independent phosphoglycerate mutase [Burkholderiales bacterium]
MTASSLSPPRPVALIILDGFGVRDDAPDNAVTRARMPFWRGLLARCPHTTLQTSALRVGLPEGQMGNSEVGHLNIGAGRVVWQELTRIDRALAACARQEPNELTGSAAFQSAIAAACKEGATLHLFGLLSPGGVHSHESHLQAFVRLAAAEGVPCIAVHAFLDGRDTPPQSAAASLAAMQAVCDEVSRTTGTQARIVSLCGRYDAMDRDKRWERTERAYRLLTEGLADYECDDAAAGLIAAYARGETDEFVQPTVVRGKAGDIDAKVRDGDAIVFMNFRADRARQLTQALTDPSFDGFPRAVTPKLAAFVT